MSAIYEENKDEDGFLYMTYSGENTFGSFQMLSSWIICELCSKVKIMYILSLSVLLSASKLWALQNSVLYLWKLTIL